MSCEDGTDARLAGGAVCGLREQRSKPMCVDHTFDVSLITHLVKGSSNSIIHAERSEGTARLRGQVT